MLLFRCGAMVAHSTVNRVVTGSSPVTGAKNKKIDDQQFSRVDRKEQEIFCGTLFG